MAQTPQQRRANEAFARAESNKRGKPTTELKKKEKPQKSPISPVWVYLLIFVVCGGLLVEGLRLALSFFS